MKKKNITELLIFIVTAEIAGAFSALLTGDFAAEYSAMNKPPLSPPGILFPIVWAVLYALMGASAYTAFKSERPHTEKTAALKTYGLQLIFNFLWSIIYFRFDMPFIAFIDILMLIFLVVTLTARFYRINTVSALLIIPYLIWIIFAAYLNIGTVILNCTVFE